MLPSRGRQSFVTSLSGFVRDLPFAPSISSLCKTSTIVKEQLSQNSFFIPGASVSKCYDRYGLLKVTKRYDFTYLRPWDCVRLSEKCRSLSLNEWKMTCIGQLINSWPFLCEATSALNFTPLGWYEDLEGPFLNHPASAQSRDTHASKFWKIFSPMSSSVL